MTDESDPFEAEVVDWLAARGRATAGEVHDVADRIDALPARAGRARSWLAAAAVVVVALGIGAVILGRIPAIGLGKPTPPDPAAFAGDPRLARCFGATVDTALEVFELQHARDYRGHLPAMGLSPELDVDAPAFVGVFRNPPPIGRLGAAPAPGATPGPETTNEPGHHDVCFLVGPDPTTAGANLYSDVDTTGLTAVLPGTLASTVPESSPTLPPRQTDPTEPSQTPKPTIPVAPTPDWAIDLRGQLACEGPVLGMGGEIPDVGSTEAYGPTATEALETFVGPGNPYASLPTTGYEPRHLEPHWAEFAYAVDGKTKTVIVLSATTLFGPGWTVMGLRSCDASEFDPSTPLTFPVTVWTTAAGHRVQTETIRSHPGPAHCGEEDAIWLYVAGQLFFRDPRHVMADWERTPFDADATKPSRARDSGFRNGDQELWIDPEGDAYLVGPDRTERWPRSTDPQLGCA